MDPPVELSEEVAIAAWLGDDAVRKIGNLVATYFDMGRSPQPDWRVDLFPAVLWAMESRAVMIRPASVWLEQHAHLNQPIVARGVLQEALTEALKRNSYGIVISRMLNTL